MGKPPKSMHEGNNEKENNGLYEISTDQLGNSVVMGEGYFRMSRHCTSVRGCDVHCRL
jgi:hypothetical protein